MRRRKRLMIITAGWEQLPLIQAARRRGLALYVVDARADAVGFKYAAARAVLEPRDLIGCAAFARAHRIEAVASECCDYSAFAAAFVAERLHLKGSTLAALQYTTNKRLMRAACAGSGVRQPAYRACHTLAETRAAVRGIGLPVIIKPVDNRGAIGLLLVTRAGEVAEAYYNAVGNSHSREILVEQFIEGTVITVEGFAFGPGRHVTLTYSSKRLLESRYRVAEVIQYPGWFAPRLVRKIFRTNQRLMRALPITFGITHTEYIVDGAGDLYFVETANRGAGLLGSSVITRVVTGFDLQRCYLEGVLGLPLGRYRRQAETLTPRCVARQSFFILRPGRVRAIHGLPQARRVPGVIDLRFYITPGTRLAALRNAAGRHGQIIVTGRDQAEAERRTAEARSRIRVEYENE